MKSIGVSVLLAQAGCPVPATQFRLSPFKSLATRILNQDNLWAGLSSFAVEMSELREIFSIADSQTLVLGDELCSGTESVSATAIVAAGLQWLLEAKACFVLATHLHDLMKFKDIIETPLLKVWHLRVEYDQVADRLLYHRDLRPGPGTTLYGLEVAKALHLPHTLLENAFSFRRTLLGEVASDEATGSSWSSQLIVKSCEKCGNQVRKTLETHHIQERQHVVNGRNQDGTAQDDLRNLVVLCDVCHDAVHSGELVVSEMIDTSEGPMRLDSIEVKKPKILKKRKDVMPQETLEKIRRVVKGHPGLSTKLLVFQIEREEGLQVKEAELKSLFASKML